MIKANPTEETERRTPSPKRKPIVNTCFDISQGQGLYYIKMAGAPLSKQYTQTTAGCILYMLCRDNIGKGLSKQILFLLLNR